MGDELQWYVEILKTDHPFNRESAFWGDREVREERYELAIGGSRKALNNIFPWEESPHGKLFWGNQHAKGMSTEGIEVLKAALQAYREGRPPTREEAVLAMVDEAMEVE